jgi:hypothetical protein
VTRLAGLDDPGDIGGWRVFLSHTSELRDFPRGASYVAAAERAVSAAGHVIVDMADFPATGGPAAQLCADRVRGCDVYVGILGTRYGSPVRDRPDVSYTELEFGAAAEAGLPRLVFLLDTDADDVGIPVSKLIDHEFGARQEAFRRRVRDSGLTVQSFASPARPLNRDDSARHVDVNSRSRDLEVRYPPRAIEPKHRDQRTVYRVARKVIRDAGSAERQPSEPRSGRARSAELNHQSLRPSPGQRVAAWRAARGWP